MSKLMLSLFSKIGTCLFGNPPSTEADAREARECAIDAITACTVLIFMREQSRPNSTVDLTAVCDDIRIVLDDVDVYFRCRRWGMAVAVAERMRSECKHFFGLMEKYQGSATVTVLMRRYIETQGPVYPPRVTRFQSWMREHLLPVEDRRRRRLALR